MKKRLQRELNRAQALRLYQAVSRDHTPVQSAFLTPTGQMEKRGSD